MSSISVVVPTLGGPRLERVLDSLASQTVAAEVIVVDDGSADASVAPRAASYDGVEVLRLDVNSGFSRACNAAAERASGDALVLLNDDCVADREFLERIAAALDPAAGVAMVASVMRDWGDPELIDSAGMELDRTLLVWDYLNGEPVSILDAGVPDPVGPSAAAAAFDREAFMRLGGFDERLFAYWEDVDLVLRLRRDGYVCRLAADARGTHEHSASFGSGSARKNELTGFGRGYVLRKWGALTLGRLPAVLARDLATCAGQAVIDRNVSGVRGRVAGWRAAAAVPREPYPAALPVGAAPGAAGTLRRRLARRGRLRRRQAPAAATGTLRTVAFFHLAETSGPSRSLERELEWQAGLGEMVVVVPEAGGGATGGVAEAFGGFSAVVAAPYEALTKPPGASGAIAALRTLATDTRRFRAIIREHRADAVVVVTAMLPAALIAARRERVPAIVYSGEIFEQRGMGRGQLAARRALRRVTGRLAAGIATGSELVAAQFDGAPCRNVEAVYPPVGEKYAGGDPAAARERFEIPAPALLVVAAGSITEGRGQDLLVRALAALRATHPEVRCVIAGAPFERAADRAFAERLSQLVGELGLEDAVTLAGQVEDVPSLFAAADVVVNPARFDEPFGRVAFEAALAGAPAVVTRVGAADELFVDGESALIVAPDDPDAIAAALARLLDDRALGERLVAGARAFAERELTPEASVAGWRRVVEAALDSRR